MTETADILISAAGIGATDPLREVLAGRADILALTQQTHDSALMPVDAGGLSRAERAAIAVRVARHNQDEALTQHFTTLLEQADNAAEAALIADLSFSGGDDQRLQALIRHTDLVTRSPKDATGADIEKLRQAGVNDADIVRLSELLAFVSYQIRVAAGLRLMRGLHG